MIEYDPLHPPNWQNPYPTYARLRDEAPVHYAEKTGTYWNYSAGMSDSNIAKRKGRSDAAGTAGELYAGIDDGMAQMRRLLTERYQLEF